MRALIVTPDRDSKGKDYTGAFRVEADRFLGAHGPQNVWAQIDIRKDRAVQRLKIRQALQDLGARAPLDLVALCCHGWRTGIQLGFSLSQIPELAAMIATAATSSAAVVLYACSTAGDGEPGTAGDGGFADLLRDCLARCVTAQGLPWRGHVDAHDRKGHCCSNPYVLRMDAGEERGGRWIVEPGSVLWGAWDRALGDRHNNSLRFRYPFLSVEAIHQELARGAPLPAQEGG